MFGTIRRHQKWLWIVIIFLTIVSFVWFFGPEAKMRDRAEFNIGSINGHKVTREEYFAAQREERISHFLSQRRWDDTARGMDEAVLQRLFWIAKLKEYNIQVSDEAVAHFIKGVFRSRETGTFNSKVYDEIVAALPGGRVTEDDMFRFFRHQVGINQLFGVVGATARILPPRVAEAAYRAEHEQLSGSLVVFALSNYTAKVVVDTNQFMAFYTNQLPRYRTPVKRQVAYVDFMATNYHADADKRMAEMTNLTMIIDENFKRRGGTNAVKDQTEAQIKDGIKDEFRHQLALEVARSNAVQFANKVYGLEPIKAANLNVVAEPLNYKVKETPAFTERDGVLGMPGRDGSQIAEAAFDLTMEQPIAPQIQTTNGTYVIALTKTIESLQPPFEEVREKALEDYRFAQAMDLLGQAGTAFQRTLSDGLAQGKTFKALADEAKVKAIEVPLFSVNTRTLPEVESVMGLSEFMQTALGVPTGRVSRYTPARDSAGQSVGFIFYARERKGVDEAVMSTALPFTMDEMRDGRQGTIIDEWFRVEFGKSGLAPKEPVPAPTVGPGAAAPKAR